MIAAEDCAVVPETTDDGPAGQKVLLVWAHPRADSLTARVVDDVLEELRDSGADPTVLDLYRSDFDPVLRETDEPDWEDLDKRYSPEVMEQIAIARNATTAIFVFPVWWYSFPALMKGYLDRVWNHGYFYGGGRRIGITSVLWIGLAGDTRHAFDKRGYTRMMEQHLNVGIASYCGATESRLELLYNTLGEGIDDMPAHLTALRARARRAVHDLVEVGA